MKSYQNLLLGIENSILTITLNRPEKLNVLNLQSMDDLKHAFSDGLNDPKVKGILITGTGSKAFAAGADISEIAEINKVNGRKFSENGQEIFAAIENSSKPVIAAVNGFALGGGCELALACHIRVASENARFGLPEVSLGIIPGYGGTQRLTQTVGKGKAFEMIMTGEIISAIQAKEIGLVNHVTPLDELYLKCLEIFSKIFDKAPIAIAQVVESINAVFNEDEDGYQTEANSFGICCNTEDFRQGTSAFIEKRKPIFKGK